MADLYHLWGNDIIAGPPGAPPNSTGDLLTVGGVTQGQRGSGATLQRLLRRLLTNPGEYIWQPQYGAGLARYLGQPLNKRAMTGAISAQMFQEQAVLQSPPPIINLTAQKNGAVFCDILYTDRDTGQVSRLQFSIS